jgi:hypothetical protein
MEGLASVGHTLHYDVNALAQIASRDSMLWSAYADMTSEMSAGVNQIITEAFARPDAFDVDTIKRRLSQVVRGASQGRLENIARTETLAAVNAGREQGYIGEFGLGGKYVFLHSGDFRECDECTALTEAIGEGKSLGEVKEMIRRAARARNGPRWVTRDWILHPQCRGVLMRVGDD